MHQGKKLSDQPLREHTGWSERRSGFREGSFMTVKCLGTLLFCYSRYVKQKIYRYLKTVTFHLSFKVYGENGEQATLHGDCKIIHGILLFILKIYFIVQVFAYVFRSTLCNAVLA